MGLGVGFGVLCLRTGEGAKRRSEAAEASFKQHCKNGIFNRESARAAPFIKGTKGSRLYDA